MTQSGHLERSTGGASDRRIDLGSGSGYLGGLNDSRKLCRLDSIFAVVAVLRVARAVGGWPVTVGAAYSIPYGQVGLLALPLSLRFWRIRG